MDPALPPPLTGTLRYPSAHLIDLVRLILIDYQSHLEAQEDAADVAEDEDTRWEATNSLADVGAITRAVDRRRWIEEEEARGGSHPEPAWKAEALKDPKEAERLLLNVGANSKAQYVIPDAVELRREKRSDLPEGSWENKDALLDLLVFISKYNHSSLFREAKDYLE